MLTTGPDALGILEVPDNGILVDYVEMDEMIEIFEANWGGGALASPTAYSIGYHPSNFGTVFKLRFSATLRHVDKFLASRDDGPVVYATLSSLTKVWTPATATGQ